MDITRYVDYFHDGSLLKVEIFDDYIVLSLESAEIEMGEIENREILCKSDTIFGKLHVKKIRNLQIDEESCPHSHLGELYRNYDDGEVLDLEISLHKVSLFIMWTNYPPKDSVDEYSKVEIEAEEVYWENIPTALGGKFS